VTTKCLTLCSRNQIVLVVVLVLVLGFAFRFENEDEDEDEDEKNNYEPDETCCFIKACAMG
jgi:hypothetical protein